MNAALNLSLHAKSSLLATPGVDHLLDRVLVAFLPRTDVLFEIIGIPKLDVIEHADKKYFLRNFREIQKRFGNEEPELRIELNFFAPLHQRACEKAILLVGLGKGTNRFLQTAAIRPADKRRGIFQCHA